MIDEAKVTKLKVHWKVCDPDKWIDHLDCPIDPDELFYSIEALWRVARAAKKALELMPCDWPEENGCRSCDLKDALDALTEEPKP